MMTILTNNETGALFIQWLAARGADYTVERTSSGAPTDALLDAYSQKAKELDVALDRAAVLNRLHRAAWLFIGEKTRRDRDDAEMTMCFALAELGEPPFPASPAPPACGIELALPTGHVYGEVRP